MKVGFDQLTKPAPLIYKRIINMLIMFIVPATVTYVEIFVSPENTVTKLRIAETGVYLIGILKGLEYFLGEDNPSSAPDSPAANEPPK